MTIWKMTRSREGKENEIGYGYAVIDSLRATATGTQESEEAEGSYRRKYPLRYSRIDHGHEGHD